MGNVVLWSQTMAIEILFFLLNMHFCEKMYFRFRIDNFQLTQEYLHCILRYTFLSLYLILHLPPAISISPFLHLPRHLHLPYYLYLATYHSQQKTKIIHIGEAHRTICRAFLFEKKSLIDFLVLSGTDIHFYHVNSIYKLSLRSETNHYPTFDTFPTPHRSHSTFKRKKENNQLQINKFFRL
jgi:hypothetical protein